MERHTPGPWKAEKGTEDDDNRWLVVADGPKQFHIASIENGQPGDCLETEGATAHLIAAAPELLEAAKEVCRAAVSVSDGCAICGADLDNVEPHFAGCSVAMLKAAVEKAEPAA